MAGKKRKPTKRPAKKKAAPKSVRKPVQKRTAPRKIAPPPKPKKTAPRKVAPPKPPKSKKAAPKSRKKKLSPEYRRRLERAEALAKAQGRAFSRSVARGHPRREKGELGVAELRQLKLAAKTPSPGQARVLGVPRSAADYQLRKWARDIVAELAGLGGLPVPDSTEGTRRGKRAERFAEMFVALGIGSTHEAFTLYFSP